MSFIPYLKKKILSYIKLRGFGVKTYQFGWKKGFTASALQISGVNKSNYHDFLSERDYVLGHPYNGAYSSIIDNKLWLPMLLHNYKQFIPQYYYFIDNGSLLPLEDCFITRESARAPLEDFFQVLKEKKKLCLKHTHSSLGYGFMLIEQKGKDFFINNKGVTQSHISQLLSSLDQYIVTEYVCQHHYSSKICSSSLNTIRFLCIWDDNKKEFFLARSYHRFGCNGNVVDNLGSGNGVLLFVDVETGKLLSQGLVNFNHKGDEYVENLRHPDNQIYLPGLQIPHFQEIKAKVLEIANKNSFLRYIGFDIAVTEEGFKIIELNSLTSLDAIQQRTGFLLDERIRKVLQK